MTVCPLCDRDAASHDGVYGVHYDRDGVLRCPNSGEPVAEAQAEVEQDKKPARKPRSKK